MIRPENRLMVAVVMTTATVLAMFFGGLLSHRTDMRTVCHLKYERKRAETDYAATVITDGPHHAGFSHRIAPKLGRIERQKLLLTSTRTNPIKDLFR